MWLRYSKNERIVQALRFSPDGHKLAEATLSAIHILDLAPLVSGLPGVELVRIPLINSNKVRLSSFYFSPAGDHLVSTEIATLKYLRKSYAI